MCDSGRQLDLFERQLNEWSEALNVCCMCRASVAYTLFARQLAHLSKEHHDTFTLTVDDLVGRLMHAAHQPTPERVMAALSGQPLKDVERLK